MNKKNAWLQTYTGKKFYIFDPKPDQIDIIDIAHSLSMMCRYNGHCQNFYSIAEHSYRCSKLIKNHKLEALMHDASEAYCHDIIRPIKAILKEYKQLELNIMIAISEKFELLFPFPKAVKDVDNILLVTERRDNTISTEYEWDISALPLNNRIIPYSMKTAERLFLNQFYKLMAERDAD